MKTATLYTDFISPFAYLAMQRLAELTAHLEIEIKPVLFAGLLNHWGQKGPAEIPAKKIHTFDLVRWYADKHGIDYQIPPVHPFNPLRALRLAIALGSTRAVAETIFNRIWQRGDLPDDAAGWAALQAALEVVDGEALISTLEVKAELRDNGEAAIAAGVFGVPTFIVDGHLFWGVDAIDMLIDYLDGRLNMTDAAAQRVRALQPSATRPDS